MVPPALVQPRNPTTAWAGRERVLREGKPDCFHMLKKAQGEKTPERELWDYITDLCHSCQGWEAQPRAYPSASWHNETKDTAEPCGSGCQCKIPRSTAGTGIGTSHITWSRLGAGGLASTLCWHLQQAQAEGHAGPHHSDKNKSTAWGTNPKAHFSPFSLVIRVLGHCATQQC